MPIKIESGLSDAERIVKQYSKRDLENHLKKGDNWLLTKDWRFIGRKEQIYPECDWRYWVCLAGRGWGKTRTIVEWAKHQIVNNKKKRIAAVAATLGDARSILVEGISGILSVMDDLGPSHNKNTGEISFKHSDAKIFLYSAEIPNRLRGPGFDSAICDELASWKYPFETWSNLLFCSRMVGTLRIAIATTPRPVKLLKDILSYDNTAISTGSTYDNQNNLSKEFIEEITKIYKDTRLGRQEIYAHILDINPDALFNPTNIDANRVKKAPDLKRIVVSVDPSGNEGSSDKMLKKEDAVGDDCGIVACGEDYDGHYYILADVTCSAKPEKWAKKACDLHESLSANNIVYEGNFGGTMVKRVLQIANPGIQIRKVNATKGKRIRAEPISMLYEQNSISHVGIFPKLEDEMTQWDPSQKYSPNRLDALVWGITWLSKGGSGGRIVTR